MKWRLYLKDGKRFKPVDWSRGITVVNLIYATLFTDEDKAKAQQDLDLPDNSHLTYEWRKV